MPLTKYFNSKRYRDLLVLGGFIILSVILRFFSFFPILISHDEGTYFVIARELFLGKTYFVDLVDTKPIGIFVLLGLFIKYISSSIFMIRLFAAIVIAFTSFTIYKISLFDQGQQKPAIAAGAIFIFMLSVFTHFGVFINPELFYTLFTAISFYIFIRTEKVSGYLLLGFLLGFGFILKYVVLFDMAAWLMYIFIAALVRNEWKSTRKVFVNCMAACMGFLVPFGVVIIYYYVIGHLDEIWFYTFGVTSRIPVERTLISTLVYIGDFHLRFLPVTFFFYYALFKASRNEFSPKISNGLIITWSVMVLVAIIIPGKPFGHYFIQFMLPVSIVAGRFFRSDLVKPYWMTKITSHPTGSLIILLLIVGNVFMQKHDYFDKPDMPAQIAEYLAPRLKPDDRIYTGNFEAVLYYLLEKESPVKYVHRSLMCNPQHRESLNIDLPYEMEVLMSKDLDYILMKSAYCYEPLNTFIDVNYYLLAEFPGEICIYKRK